MSLFEQERLMKVENQEGLFRDTVNNSILFKQDDSYESRKKYFLDIAERIKKIENTLEKIERRIAKLENIRD